MQEFICPQADPGWVTIATAVLSGQNITGTGVPPFTPGDIPPVDPRTSEDCLYLDLLVPTGVYEKKTGGAPVVVWIHSGGFVMGYKDQYGDGAGLVTRSQQDGSQGVIFIAINYRLGLFVRPTHTLLPAIKLTCTTGLAGWNRIPRERFHKPRHTGPAARSRMDSKIHPPIRRRSHQGDGRGRVFGRWVDPFPHHLLRR